jgi:hypothetical protein
MSTVESSEIVDVLERVKTWSPPERITLARRILETLEPADTPAPPRTGRSVQELIGMGAGDSPPPDDDTVRRWIDEQRVEKYG